MVKTYAEDAPGLDGGIGRLQSLDVTRQRGRNGVRIVVSEPFTELLLLLLCVGGKPFTTLSEEGSVLEDSSTYHAVWAVLPLNQSGTKILCF